MYQCIKAHVTSNNEKAQAWTKEEFKAEMQGLDKLSPTREAKILELSWKYREVFEPVKPGKITKYFHEIITTTERPTNVRPYPLKSGEEKEFVRTN